VSVLLFNRPTTTATNLHPAYTQWAPEWVRLAHAYEGDAGFLDGTYLTAHPREWQDWNAETPSKPTKKLIERRQLARYENVAQVIVERKRAALFRRPPIRRVQGATQKHQYLDWAGSDVDGAGSNLTNFMADMWRIAGVFGHCIVVMDRVGGLDEPITRADQGTLTLRLDTPLDVPDWITDGGRLQAIKLDEGKRAFFYGCSSYHKRGGTVCSNRLELPLAALDRAVLDCIAAHVLQPAVIQEAIERALVSLAPERREAEAQRARADLAGIEAELARLSAAIAAGVPLDAVVATMQDRQGRREALQRQLAALERSLVAVDLAGLRGRLEGKLVDWRGLLSRHVTQTRQVLRKLLPDPIVLMPHADMRGAVLQGTAAVDVLIRGLFPCATNLASPGGRDGVYEVPAIAWFAA
jgi:hypothetical protein